MEISQNSFLYNSSKHRRRILHKAKKRVLVLAIHKGKIPIYLKPLMEALAAQCFLNEYVYSSSKEEDNYVVKLIEAACENRKQQT